MKILIAGSNGMIGSAVAAYLASQGHEVNRLVRQAPAFLLRLMLGEMAEALILASRRILPGKLLDAGYQFHFANLADALHHELAIAE